MEKSKLSLHSCPRHKFENVIPTIFEPNTRNGLFSVSAGKLVRSCLVIESLDTWVVATLMSYHSFFEFET